MLRRPILLLATTHCLIAQVAPSNSVTAGNSLDCPSCDFLKAALPMFGVVLGGLISSISSWVMSSRQTEQAARLKRFERRSEAYSNILKYVGKLQTVVERRYNLLILDEDTFNKGIPFPEWAQNEVNAATEDLKTVTNEFRDQLNLQSLFLPQDARDIIESMRRESRNVNPATAKDDLLHNIKSLQRGYEKLIEIGQRDLGYK